MASPEPAAQPSPAQEPSTPAAAGREEAPREPVPEAAAPGAAAAAEKVEGEVEEEEKEEGECGFCLFMKAGGCKDVFVAWEECVKAAQEGADMVERCYEVTVNLKTCMDAHADYYAPVLQAEQAINERAEAEAAAAAAAAKEEPASDAEKKGEAVPQQAAPASPASGEGKTGEAVAEKSTPLALGTVCGNKSVSIRLKPAAKKENTIFGCSIGSV
ncbi:myristoylated alanine-rich C-kinase substrate-like [Panicum miliaceum]|uniref:Myristoylated alanine-rich C-kinase substrate-like n=1 Tax=Panicum miliaceum TaxID=4540 RepID=A0A3L6T962_PANMI|nr:myristoylated alanine-rich C-kinase substrate-like [Panicum miliaceum]